MWFEMIYLKFYRILSILFVLTDQNEQATTPSFKDTEGAWFWPISGNPNGWKNWFRRLGVLPNPATWLLNEHLWWFHLAFGTTTGHYTYNLLLYFMKNKKVNLVLLCAMTLEVNTREHGLTKHNSGPSQGLKTRKGPCPVA